MADRLHPIVLRELRQMSRNRFVMAMVITMLVVLFLISSLFLLYRLSGRRYGMDEWENVALGSELLQGLFLCLFVGSCMLIPPYAAVRFGWERSPRNFDLMYISTLSPSSIVLGKVMAALHLCFLAVAIACPFLSLTYLLRGVELLHVFCAIIWMFAAVMTWTLGLMCYAVLPLGMVARILGFVLVVGPIWFLGTVGFGMFLSDTLAAGDVLEFTAETPFILFVWSTCMITLYGVTTQAVSPKPVYEYEDLPAKYRDDEGDVPEIAEVPGPKEEG